MVSGTSNNRFNLTKAGERKEKKMSKKLDSDKKRKMVAFRMPPWLIAELDKLGVNKSRYIIEAVTERLISDGVVFQKEVD